GMDPYLEDRRLWAGLHSRLIVYLADAVQKLVRPRYIAAVEDRVYLVGPDREISPDVWVWRGRAESRARPHAATQSSAAVLDNEDETPLLVKVHALEIHE